MKQDITTARKIAEKHLDEMMSAINPAVGFTFDLSHTAYLMDIPRQRLILDREPDEREKAALLAYSLELQLRTSDKLEFELDGSLYHRDREKGEYRRYYLDGTSWKSEEISLMDFIKISEFAAKQTVSDADRATRAKEDMERIKDEMEKKPTGKVVEG